MFNCFLCGEELEEGFDTESIEVIQVVQDKHPTYDKEIPLLTAHEDCWTQFLPVFSKEIDKFYESKSAENNG